MSLEDNRAAATAATPAPTAAPAEDRGDVYVPPADEPDADALSAVLAAAPAEPAATPAPTPAPSPAPEDDKHGGIPKARFNEVNEERKRLKEELDAAKRELAARAAPAATPAPTAAPTPTPPPFDEDAKEAEYAEALMEGDTKKALALRKEINTHVRTTAKAEAEAAAESRFEQRQAETTAQAMARDLDAASVQAVKDFPYLDTEDGAEALELIVAARDAKMARGIAAGEALRAAVAAIAPKFAPAAAAAPAAPAPSGAPAVDQRAADALTRGAADSLRQPAGVQAGVGNRATAGRIDVKALTDAEFDALPAAEKRRLRGDAG